MLCSPRMQCFSFASVLLLLLLLLIGSFDYASPSVSSLAHDDDDSSACPPRCQGVPKNNNNKKEGLRIFYLITVHNNRTLQDAVHLVRTIRDPRNTILVHIDTKALSAKDDEVGVYSDVLHQEAQACPCGSVIRIESVYDVKWSHWSMNLPTLWGIKVAVSEYWGHWDVLINLSGDTLPVYTPDRMSKILAELPYNFVTSSSCETGLLPTNVYHFPKWWHKRAHYTNLDSEPDPVFWHQNDDQTWQNQTIVTHFGSQWMILQATFCQWLVRQLERPNSLASLYRDYLLESEKLMTDETFIPSLIMHVDEFRETLPRVDDDGFLLWKNGSRSDMLAVRYERMDEHVPTSSGYFPTDQRYEVPKSSSSTIDQPRPWGPYFLGVYDLANIVDSGALFVRKVSVLVDPNMIALLPVDDAMSIPYIVWPEEVVISEKPDWEKEKQKLLAQRKHAAGKDAAAADDNNSGRWDNEGYQEEADEEL